MKFIKTTAVIAAALGLAACDDGAATSRQPAVGSSSDLSAFEGARAGQAEMGIQNLGYELARSEGLTNYWFNAETGTCAEITTSDGRYASVNMVPSSNC